MLQKSVNDFFVFPGLQIAKPDRLLVPVLIVARIDDSHDPPDSFLPTKSEQ